MRRSIIRHLPLRAAYLSAYCWLHQHVDHDNNLVSDENAHSVTKLVPEYSVLHKCSTKTSNHSHPKQSNHSHPKQSNHSHPKQMCVDFDIDVAHSIDNGALGHDYNNTKKDDVRGGNLLSFKFKTHVHH